MPTYVCTVLSRLRPVQFKRENICTFWACSALFVVFVKKTGSVNEKKYTYQHQETYWAYLSEFQFQLIRKTEKFL